MTGASGREVRVGVGVVIERDGRVLLGERKGAHGAGTWACPGGHLEFGETVEECAAREVAEETGLVVEGIEPIGFTNDRFPGSAEGGGWHSHYVTLFVRAHAPEGEARVLEPEQCAQWRWCLWSSLPRPLFLPLANLLSSEWRSKPGH